MLAAALWVAGPLPVFAQTADVTLDNVTITASGVSYKAPRLLVRGTTLSRTDLLRIFDAQAPEPLADRVAKLNASSIEASEVIAEVTTPQGKQTTTYRDARFGPVASGRIGTVTAASGGTETVLDGKPGGKGTFGPFSLQDLDLGLAIGLLTEKASTDATLKPIYRSFSVADMRIQDPKGLTMRIGRIAGRDFLAKPTSAGWLGSVQAMSDTPDLQKATPEARRRSLDALGELLASISIGSVEVSDIDFTPPDGGSGKITRVSYSSDAATTGSATIRMEGIEGGGKAGRMKLGVASLNGVSMGPMIRAMRDSDAWAEGKPDPKAARALASLIGSFRLEGLEVAGEQPDTPVVTPWGGGSAGGASPAAKPFQLTLGGVEFVTGKQIEGIPTEMKLGLRHLAFSIPGDSDNDGLKQLIELGYEKIDASMGLDLGWNEGERQLLLRDLSAEGAGMGSVAIRATIGNVTKDVFNPDTAIASVAAVGAAAKTLDIVVDNRGLFEKIVARESKRQRRPPEDVRREYGTAAAVGIPAILGGSQTAKDLGQAVAKFVAKPGKLTLRAKSKQPGGFGIADFAAAPNPASVLEALDVVATNE